VGKKSGEGGWASSRTSLSGGRGGAGDALDVLPLEGGGSLIGDTRVASKSGVESMLD